MWKSTFNFSLDRDGNQALIVMDCGGGVMRCRTMSIETLAAIVRACEHVQQHIVGVLAAEEGFGNDVPPFPECIEVAGGKNIAGVCNISVVASKRHGRILFSTALYDLPGGDAPALLLTDEQLDRFIEQAKGLLMHEPGSERREPAGAARLDDRVETGKWRCLAAVDALGMLGASI